MSRQPYDWELWLDLNIPICYKGPRKLRSDAPEDIIKKFVEHETNEIKESKKKRALLRHCAISAIENQFKEGLEIIQERVVLSPTAMIDLIANFNDKGEWVPSSRAVYGVNDTGEEI